MKRYYYTDPLAAAWMAKHFGMLIKKSNSGVASNIWHLILGWDQKKFYIHPDSLYLLEPQTRDFYMDDYGHGYRFANDDSRDLVVRIIQRVGKPFHWPECEEVTEHQPYTEVGL